MNKITRNMPVCLLALAIPVLLFATQAHANGNQEFAFFIEQFLQPYPAAHQDIASLKKIRGVQWLEEERNEDGYDLKRMEGQSFITALRKEYVAMLEGEKIEVPWHITASARQGSLLGVSMAPDDAAWGKGNSGADIPFAQAISLNDKLSLEYLCSAVEYAGSDQADYYILRAGNKRNVVAHSSIWGSGGASDTFIIKYDMEPEKNAAMQALRGTCNRTEPMSPSSNLYWYGLEE